MTNIWLFRIAVTILFINCFLVYDSLPNSLFTSKELGLGLAAGICCILTALKVFNLGSTKIKVKVIDILVFAILFLLPISDLLFNKDGNNTSKILNQINFGICYFSIRILSIGIRQVFLIKTIIVAFLILLCCNLIIAAAQYFSIMSSCHTNFSVTGMFFNPAPFAILIAMLLSIVGILIVNSLFRNNYFILLFYCILVCIAVFFLINCMSRSAWLGSFFGLLIACLYYFNEAQIKISTSTRKLSLSAFILLFPAFVYWLYYLKEASSIGRLLIWNVTALMLKENWLFGVGIGNFAPKYIFYQAKFFEENDLNIQKYGNLAGDVRYAFNDAIQIFCETGIFGLLIFVLIIALCGKQIFKSLNKGSSYRSIFNYCIFSGLLTVIIAGASSYPLTILPLAILFWFMIAVSVSMNTEAKISFNTKVYFLKTLLPILLFTAGISHAYYGFIKLKAYLHWTSITFEKDDIFEINDLLMLYSALNTEPNYLNRIASYYIKNGHYLKAIPYLQRATKFSPYKGFYYALGNCQEKIGNYREAKMNYTLIEKAIPNLIKPKYLLAKLCYKHGDFTQFRILSTKAIMFVPKIDSEEVMEMKEELVILQNTLDSVANFLP
ncbi:O-antigen ligase family protein [Pedobacter hiemivivus]|uniref:O-antigen ligase family protein n=1 Tax=Pedobacter hiemivivus TaxID=2530454 RepID=A0A4U1G228_9SPHI|nr:O-antigen ligase family protein [Pedobacter hiemivivus]TKC57597.1 O-antigen ligase family protein [Pedobacter hiemivivus]